MFPAGVTSAALPRFGRLAAWGGLAVATVLAPLAVLALEHREAFAAALPTVDASLNATSAVLLYTGRRAIRAGRVARHWKLMLAAFAASALFLGFYLLRFALTGAHRYPRQDVTRTIYLAVLGTHTLCAAAVPVLATTTLVLATRSRFERHRRWARVAYPIWMYVSVTGVIVYLMLYHLAGV
jgi:putative membrane protein